MLADARAILDRALAHAGELGVPMTIAIVDGGGNLVALQRMDGAGFATPEVAWGKAWTTAALEGRFGAAIPFSAAVSVATHGRFTPRQGGLPLAGGGGVGASGGTGEQDEDVVRAGIGAGAS
jgi:uncharacterized protein GlcG (DUF336 family)